VTLHITEQLDALGVRERVVAEMSRVYKGNIVFGTDLFRIPFGSVAPGKRASRPPASTTHAPKTSASEGPELDHLSPRVLRRQ